MGTSDEMVLAQARAPFTARIGEILRGERATLGRSLLDVQRELKIRAIYIDAIENADPSVFPNKSFIPGYVRSYARYLGLDPEQVTAQFRAETGIEDGGKNGGPATPRRAAKAGPGVFRPNFPMAERAARGLPLPPLSALGSVLGLAGLLGALGYGGWTVLQNVQRVQFAPVEEAPAALASVEGLTPPVTPGVEAAELGDLARPVAETQLAELYRKQELEVPILAPRDGPIAAIDPERVGLLAQVAAAPVAPATPTPAALVSAPPAAVVAPPSGPVTVAAAASGSAAPGQETPGVTIVAERAAWIRVYRADKSVIFEKILETGETYSPPPETSAPLIWAGNSGSVYVRIGDQLRGPLGPGTKAVRDVPLDPAALSGSLPAVSMAPEVISRAFDAAAPAAPIAVR